ncbi:MAG: protease inhibitor Inh/omp19 family protein [Methylobacterium sp.]|uniref:AprI/Inh family metalloprotease inhibitor n=1 Tax=Methylobacterium sp. TaxID=409 RepID=UPI0025CDBB41|nr:AprI/Inh family metalloprotease inhibitor [Methylobacterium sp.]MBX9931327.1 protease inhibitor Inh/omp19 family protein [Methylobacterium sp.]
MRLALAAVVVVLGSLGAPAQTLPDHARDSLGEWLAAPEDGKPGCRLKLTSERTIGGWSAVPAPDCSARLPKLAEASAWDYEGGIRLFDATRRKVATFEEDETTLLKTRVTDVPAILLVRAKAGIDRAPSAAQVAGLWTMRRPGGTPLCAVTLGTEKQVGEGGTVLAAAPCDAAVAKLKLSRWQIEDFALMLYGGGDSSLRFEPGPEGFVKAEAGRPLEMVRASPKGDRQ